MWMGAGVVMVLVFLEVPAFASQNASLYDFYSPVKYSGNNAYQFKIHNLENGVTKNMDSAGVVDYTYGSGPSAVQFHGGIDVFKGPNGNNWMYSTLNWGGWNSTDDGTSVIRLYEDTGSGFTYHSQVYYEGKNTDPAPGDRILMGLSLANIDGDSHQDMIVAVKYANENQYFNWYEDDGTGNFAPVSGAANIGGILASSKWLAHGIETGNWTGVTEFGGKPVVSELLITAEYDPGTFNDSTYLFHKYVVDNGDGTYSIADHSYIYMSKGSPGPFWTGVAVLGPSDDPDHPSADGWLDIVLATNYIDENSYYSRAYYNPNYDGRAGVTSSHWAWQTSLLKDTNTGRDFNDVDAMMVPEPVSLGLLLLGLPMFIRRRR